MKKIKSFRGISVDLFELRANSFDGYGFSVFIFTWLWETKVTMSNSAALFMFNIRKDYEYGGEEWTLTAGAMFFRWRIKTWVIKPRKPVCLNCGEYCEDNKYFFGKNAYCSDSCKQEHDFVL